MRTKILDQEFARLGNGVNVGNKSLAVLQQLLGLGIRKTQAVEIANLGLSGDNLLDIFDIGTRGDLDGFGETLEELRSCGNAELVSSCALRTHLNQGEQAVDRKHTAIGKLDRSLGGHDGQTVVGGFFL